MDGKKPNKKSLEKAIKSNQNQEENSPKTHGIVKHNHKQKALLKAQRTRGLSFANQASLGLITSSYKNFEQISSS